MSNDIEGTLSLGDNEAAAVIEVAKEAAEANRPFAAKPGEVYLTPYEEDDGTRRLDIEDLEHLLDEPRRLSDEYRFDDVESFVSFVGERRDPDRTTIWVSDEGRAVAVFNDAGTDSEPGWRDHRAELILKRTPEWLFWLRSDREALDQIALAEHIEDGIKQVVKPDGAELHEMACFRACMK